MITNILLFFYLSLLHPLHLSVCDIFHNSEKNTLEITQRIFADDLEDALRNRSNGKVDVFNPKNPEILSQLIGEYVQENFELLLNSRPIEVNYLGYEVEEDAIWVYQEAPKVRNFKSITVRSTLFFEMFDDQLNLINVKKNDTIRSLKIQEDNKQSSLTY